MRAQHGGEAPPDPHHPAQELRIQNLRLTLAPQCQPEPGASGKPERAVCASPQTGWLREPGLQPLRTSLGSWWSRNSKEHLVLMRCLLCKRWTEPPAGGPLVLSEPPWHCPPGALFLWPYSLHAGIVSGPGPPVLAAPRIL